MQAKAAVGNIRNGYSRNGPVRCTEVVCYKGSTISYEIGIRLINKYISLVNLIMDKLVVKN